MKFVSPLLKHAVFPGLSTLGYLRHRDGAAPAVVTYHGILPKGYQMIDSDLDGSLVTADSFLRQIRLLKRHYNVITPQQFLGWCETEQKLPARAVLLTCDDDLRNTLTDMVPMLQEHGLSCLFFVTGASLGEVATMHWYEQLYLMLLLTKKRVVNLDVVHTGFRDRVMTQQEKRILWWGLVKHLSRFNPVARQTVIDQVREQLGLGDDWSAQLLSDSLRRRFLMLNAGELRALVAAGMSVGAHTLSHPVLSQLSPEDAWEEISASRCRLQETVDKPVWALAYPFGDASCVTEREREMAQRAGFTCAFLNVGGGFGAEMPRFALPRVHVTGEMNLGEFEAHVSGFYRVLRGRFLGAS
jgi:peptidoglycan/xylan/chitin deacetylase (PgdA/CDA1 family)